jgi:hypothetical protein
MSTAQNTVLKSVSGKSAAQVLEENKARYQALIERRQRLQVELEAAARQLREAQDEAERDFGTRDIDALRAMYAKREEENEQKVAQFVQDLDALEAALVEVERQLAS